MFDKNQASVPGAQTQPQHREESSSKPRLLPPYRVVLLNDDDHSFDYVIEMLGALFRITVQRAQQMAEEVDRTGRVTVLTTTKEHAELKRDQIHAFGPDRRMDACQGAMSAVIEPAG